MPAIAVKPYMISDCLLTLGADNYEAHASKIEFVPTVTKTKFKGSTPSSVHNFIGTPEWVMKLTRISTSSQAASSRRNSVTSEGEPLPAVNSQGMAKPVSGSTSGVVRRWIECSSCNGAWKFSI